MSEDNRSIIERLDNIEEKIEALDFKKTVQNDKYAVTNFILNGKKQAFWVGAEKKFADGKEKIILLLSLTLIFGLLSTLVTSLTFKFYSTFTFLENIWLIFVVKMLIYFNKLENNKMKKEHFYTKSMRNYEFSNLCFYQPTNKIRLSYKVFNILACLSTILNIIFAWSDYKANSAIAVTIFEVIILMFYIISILMSNKFLNKFDLILFVTNKKINSDEDVTIVIYLFINKIISKEDFLKQNIEGVLLNV